MSLSEIHVMLKAFNEIDKSSPFSFGMDYSLNLIPYEYIYCYIRLVATVPNIILFIHTQNTQKPDVIVPT